VSIVPGLGGVKYAVDTDDQGHFQLGGVLQGSWTLQLRRDGFRPEARDINVGSDTNLLDFHLSPTGQVASLTGVVRLWGTDRAIPGVRVMLGTGEYEAFADETGRYTFVGLPAGTYVLTATKNGYEPLRLPAVTVLAGGTATTDFALSFAASGPTVFGKVVDWISGMPVRRATVGIQSDSGLLLRSDVTDCTGYFQLLDVPTGSNQIVRVAAAGYRNRAFAVSFDNYLEMDIQLQRASNWRAPRAPQGSGPVARVAQSAIYLANLQQSATLDGSPSTGANLSYLWRELPDNPRVGLIPPGSTTLPTFQISRFNAPGAYHFELQVRSGDRVSANTATITVFAPGVSGNVHVSPSDGVYGLNQVTVRAFTNYADALRWDLGYVDSKLTLDSPQGDFRLDGLSTGLYWIAAHAQPGSGYLNYGPVARHVNFGSAMRHMAVNMSRVEHRLYGTIRDRASLAVLENVRVVIASGSLSESFRTTTDADGYYVLTAVPEGNNQPVLLVKEGYQTAISKTSIFGDTRKDMTMVRNASGGLADLRGFITAQYMALSYPIPHAEVVVGGGLVRAFTDANGYYEIHGLPPGEYFGQVRKAGYRKAELSQTGSVTLSVGANRVDRTLVYTDQGPVVRGIVVGAGQEAIEGATVTVLRPAAGTRSPGVGVSGVGCQVSGEAGGSLKTLEGEGVVSDAGGFAQLVGVPDGVRHVLVRLPNGGVFTNALTVSGAMEAVITVPPVFEEYDRWVTNYFRDPAASNALVYADADGDGIDNLTECVMDTSPLARNERLCLEPDYAKGCVLTLPVSSRRRMYQIHWSTNLVRGLWQYHGTATAGTGGHLTLSATNDAVVRPKCFYRAGVRLP
jgi:hypothetical protein